MFAAAFVASISLHHFPWPCTAIPSSCPPHTALLVLHQLCLHHCHWLLHYLTLHSSYLHDQHQCRCTRHLLHSTPRTRGLLHPLTLHLVRPTLMSLKKLCRLLHPSTLHSLHSTRVLLHCCCWLLYPLTLHPLRSTPVPEHVVLAAASLHTAPLAVHPLLQHPLTTQHPFSPLAAEPASSRGAAQRFPPQAR